MKRENKNSDKIQQELFKLKQSKKKLKEIEALRLSILNSVPHAVIGLKNREITFANEFVKNVFGWEPKDLIGKNSRILYPSDKEFENIGKYFYPELEKQQNCNGEILCRRKDGKNIICKITASRIGETSKDEKIVVTYEDITERKRSEEIFKKNQQEFSSLFSSSPDAAIYHDEKGVILKINPRFTALFGYTLEEIKGRNINEGMIFPRINSLKESEELTKLALEGKVVTRETIRKKKDGSLISVIISIAPVITEGQCKGIIAFYQDITERKKIQEELQKSKENYQLLLENQDDLVTKIDPKGRFLFVSPSYCHMYGKTKEQLLGNSFMSLVHVEDRDMVAKSIEKLYKPPYTCYHEQRANTKNGWRWIAWADKAILDKNGKVAEIVCVGRDVTERKKAEEELRQSEEKLLSIFNHIPDAAFYQDTIGTILDINPAFTELFGFTKKEILGKNIDEIGFYPKEKIKEGKYLTIQSIKKNVITLETIRLRKDGNSVPVSISTSPVEINGKLTGILVLYRDITERKKMEKALRKSEERFRALIEGSSDIIQVVDAKGDLTYVSPSVREVLGYKPDELIGTPVLDIVHPEDHHKVIESLKKIEENSDKPLNTICRCKHKKGTWRILEVKSVNHLNNPAIRGFVSNTRDITERMENEQLKTVLYNISKSANSSISLKELYPIIHHELGQIIDVTNFYIALLDKEENKIYFPYHVDEREDDFNPLDINEKSLTAYVLKNKFSMLLNYEKIKELNKQGELLNAGVVTKNMFWFGVPLRVEDDVFGVLAVQSYTNPYLYSEKDIHLLEFASIQVAMAIDRKQTEEALKKSQQEFSNLFNNSPEALVYLDDKSKVININPRFTELFGYKLEEIKGRNINDGMIHPTGKLKEGNKLDETALSEGYFNFESVRRKKDGSLFPVLISGSNIIIDATRKGLIGSYLDISGRKKIEKALQESQKMFLSLFKSSPEALVYTDDKTKIINVNPRFTELFGYKLEEIQGKNLIDGMIYSPEFSEEAKKIFKESLEHDFYIETIRKKKNGTLFPVSISISRVKTDSRFNGLIIVYQDISKRKHLEEELRKFAHYDQLTSACNRGYGLALLQQQLKLAKRTQSSVLLVYIDLDDFKNINDNFGHKEGDKVLKVITRMFKENLREIDIITRIGGDEFLIVLPGSSRKDIQVIKRKLSVALNRLNNEVWRNYSINFTLGFSWYDPKNPKSMDELIQLADKRMYKEKKIKKILQE